MVKTSPSNAVGAGSIPVRGAKIPHALWPKNQNIKQKQYCNKFNKDFKFGPHQNKKILKKNKDSTYLQIQSHSEVLGVRTSTQRIWRNTVQHITTPLTRFFFFTHTLYFIFTRDK